MDVIIYPYSTFSTGLTPGIVEIMTAAVNAGFVGCRHSCITHWSRVIHTCVGNLTSIGSDNGLSPGRRQTITWTNAGILLIGPLGTNFCGILIEICRFSFKKMYLRISSVRWRPFCSGLNVLPVTDEVTYVDLRSDGSAGLWLLEGTAKYCAPGSRGWGDIFDCTVKHLSNFIRLLLQRLINTT